MQTLKFGSRGEDVKVLQSYLNLYADGIFGKMTEESVKQFQKDNGLVGDCIVGTNTWNKLKQIYIKKRGEKKCVHILLQV